jgi:hypothetical protein
MHNYTISLDERLDAHKYNYNSTITNLSVPNEPDKHYQVQHHIIFAHPDNPLDTTKATYTYTTRPTQTKIPSNQK